jgi:hypothetical protein
MVVWCQVAIVQMRLAVQLSCTCDVTSLRHFTDVSASVHLRATATMFYTKSLLRPCLCDVSIPKLLKQKVKIISNLNEFLTALTKVSQHC